MSVIYIYILLELVLEMLAKNRNITEMVACLSVPANQFCVSTSWNSQRSLVLLRIRSFTFNSEWFRYSPLDKFFFSSVFRVVWKTGV